MLVTHPAAHPILRQLWRRPQAPEVRLLRYQTFLRNEIVEHSKAGRVQEKEAEVLIQEVDQNLVGIRQRLMSAKPT